MRTPRKCRCRCVRGDSIATRDVDRAERVVVGLKRRAVVAQTADSRGLCLRATVPIEAGESVIGESALFVYAMDRAPTVAAVDCIFLAFQQLPSRMRDAVWNLFCPAGALPSLEDSEGYALASEEKRALLGILKLNSVHLPGQGAGVFATISRANHSCQPNARFKFGPGRTYCSLVAMRRLAAGDEITVSYISESNMLLPISHRRKMLSNWNFTCCCPRCAASSDDTRGMRCPACGVNGIYPSPAGSWLPCIACDSQIPEDELHRAGSRWWVRYNAISPMTKVAELRACQSQRGPFQFPRQIRPQPWMSDLVGLHHEMVTAPAAAPGTDTHWIASEVAGMAAEAHLWRGELSEAAAAAALRLGYINRVLAGAETQKVAAARFIANAARSAAGT